MSHQSTKKMLLSDQDVPGGCHWQVAALCALLLALAAGCSSSTTSTPAVTTTADSNSGTDALGDDQSGDDSSDVLVLPETTQEETPCSKDHGWGCTCGTNDDCDSGWCVEAETGKVCTKTCTSSCPKDWKCTQAPGTDLTYVCVPQYTNLCKPCKTHEDCASSGQKVGDGLCVPHDDGTGFVNGSFCGTGCSETKDCKSGFSCKDVAIPGVEGTVKQCMPDAGDCSCLPAWISTGAATTCSKINDFGTCSAARVCTSNGLTLCDVASPEAEICDDIDNDCNGQTDEDGAVGCVPFYPDTDGDGFGIGEGQCLCNDPGPGYASQGGDCNDLVTAVKPGAQEICDNQDNDCNGQTDESGAKGCKVFYKDKDGDKYGDVDDSACLCPGKKGSDWLEQGGDCDDSNKSVHPGVTELCNDIDDNCNSKTDEEGADGCKLFYVDADGDTYGPTASGKCLCKANKLYASDQPGDCDDSNAKANPTQLEICNGTDDDCNGQTDDGNAASSCPPVSGGQVACIAGKCGIGKCGPGLFDVDLDMSNGCECSADSNYGVLGNVCGNAIELGDMPDGSNTVTAKGNLMPGEDADWFHFYAKDQPDDNTCDQFDVRVKFASNPNSQFIFDVYRKSCAGADQVCTGSLEHSWSTSFYGDAPTGSDAKPQVKTYGDVAVSPVPEKAGECKCVAMKPEPNFNGLPGMNLCSDNSAHYYVRVYRKAGIPSSSICVENGYIIQVNNSPP